MMYLRGYSWLKALSLLVVVSHGLYCLFSGLYIDGFWWFYSFFVGFLDLLKLHVLFHHFMRTRKKAFFEKNRQCKIKFSNKSANNTTTLSIKKYLNNKRFRYAATLFASFSLIYKKLCKNTKLYFITLYLPECKRTPRSKQVRYLKFQWQQLEPTIA